MSNGNDPSERKYGETHVQHMERLGGGPRLERLPPASLNEGVFDIPIGYEQDGLIVDAHAALKRGREAAEHAQEMAQAQLANEMLTEPARHRAAKIGVHRITKPAVERFQGVIERFHAKLKALDDTLTGPQLPTRVVDQMEMMSVRTTLLGMPAERRRQVILAALKSDTPSSIETAVLRGPAFLSGCSDVEQADFRLAWQKKRRPDEVARANIYRMAQEHLERGGTLLLGWAVSLYDEKMISAAEAHEKRATEALNSGTTG